MTTEAPQSPSGASGSAVARTPYVAGSALLAVAVAVSLLAVPYLPTHDGPQHVFAAWFLNHVDGAAAPLSAWLLPNGSRVTSMGFDLWFRPLEAIAGWRAGTQLALAASAVLWLGGWFALIAAATERRGHPIAWLLVPTALPWMLYMGYFNYLAGLAVFGWALWLTRGVLIVEGSARWVRLGALTVVMAFASVAHSFAASLAGLFIASGVIHDAVLRRAPQRILWFALPALPVFALVLGTLGGVANLDEAMRTMPTAQRLTLAAGTLVPSGVAGGALAGPTGALWLALGAGGALYAAARGPEPVLRGWGLAAALAVAVHTVAPFDIPGWQAFAPRWGVPGVAAGVSLLAICLARREHATPALGIWAATALVAVSLVVRAGLDHETVWSECGEPYTSAHEVAGVAEAIPAGGTLGSLTLMPCGASLADRYPLTRFNANAEMPTAMDAAALPDVYTGYAAVHAFAVTDQRRPATISDWAGLDYGGFDERGSLNGPPNQQPRAWLEVNGYLASAAARRDATLTTGPVEAVQEIASRGFQVVPAGDIAVLRFEGCLARLQPPPPTPVTVHAAFFPDDTLLPMRAAPDGAPPGVVRTPCGPTELLIWHDVDANGVRDELEPYCAGDDGTSRGRRMVPPGGVDLPCVWVTP